MRKLTPTDGARDVEQFDPDRYRLKVAALDYGIEEAKRIKDWPTLEEAVDRKIEEQRKFCAWWGATVVGRGAGRGNKTRRDPGVFSESDAEELTGMLHQRVSDLGKKLKQPGDKYRIHLLGAGYRAAMLEAAENHRAEGTGENEWYTPPQYLDLVRKVLGEIDLDPASSEKAQREVQAARYFTKKDNGLEQEWLGRVWLNPPYTQPDIANFASKMVEERAAGRVTAAIMLTHNYTDTSWFHALARTANAICFTRGRIKFLDADGADCAPTQGQAFFYFGDDVPRFASVFIGVGFVVRP